MAQDNKIPLKVCKHRINLIKAAHKASENPIYKTPEERDNAYHHVMTEGKKREVGEPKFESIKPS